VDGPDIVVFLGPSLPVDDARRILPARYLGPARCGDVLRARRLSPRAIALVDGLFASTPATWHKEILLALDDGIAVFGASSMGALRAAELAPFGMIGVGAIFEAYRDGVYTDDDEVALLHGPAGSDYRELSEAMVNIRATVARAVACDVICPESAERVVRHAKDTFYQERSIATAIDWAWAGDTHAEEPTRFRRFIANGGYVNQKRLDAMQLLTCLGRHPTAPPTTVSSVPRTSFIVKLHYDTACRPLEAAEGDLPIEERVALEARNLGRLFPLVSRLAQLMAMAHALGDGHTIDQANAGGLDETAPAACVARVARVRAVVDDYLRRHGSRKTARLRRRHMLDLMRLDGAYPRLGLAGRLETAAGPARRGIGRRGSPEIDLYRRIAELWTIVDEQLERAGVAFAEPLQTLSDAFRRARGLDRRASTLAWRRANGLDGRDYQRLVITDARLGLVSAGAQLHAVGLVPSTEPAFWLVDAIRLVGLYTRLERRVLREGAAHAVTPGGRTAA